MRKWSFEALSLMGIIAMLTLLSILGWLVCYDTKLTRAAGMQVADGYAHISRLEVLRADLYQAENTQQRYLLAPSADNLTRRDALERKLTQDVLSAADHPGSQARMQGIQDALHQHGARRHAGSGDADAGIYLAQAALITEDIIAQQRAVLAQVKLDAEAQVRRTRNSRIALLLTLTTLTIYMSLKIRSVLISRQTAYTLLQESETRYRQIVETAQEGIWLTDAETRIIFANGRMAEMIGCTLDDLLGHPVSDFMPETVLQRCCPIYRREDTSLRDLRYLRADGVHAWAMMCGRLLRDDNGAVRGALVMMTDITERKLAEQALTTAHDELENRIRLRTAELEDSNALLRAEIEVRRATEQALVHSEVRLQEIISMMPVSLFLKDADSRVILMNEACEQQWGMRQAELIGRGDAQFPPDQMAGFLAADQAAFATRRLIVNDELIWNATLQESRLVQTFKKPIFDADGKPLMLIAMSVDITDRKRNEEALQQSFIQLRALSDHQETIKEEERKRIALDIHDDLGQNLMALKIDVSMLHARTGTVHPRLNRQVRRVLDTIDASIQSVRCIINDLHPSTLELGLCAAVEWLLRQFERRSAPRYKLTILDDSANAGLDQRHTAAIFRVIQESLANIVRHAEASEVEVTLNLHPQQLTIIIADNGIGIKPGDHGKAASYGLKSIKERIGALGGELVIDSRMGTGTMLSILMPVTAMDCAETSLATPA